MSGSGSQSGSSGRQSGAGSLPYAPALGPAAFAVALDGESKRFHENREKKKEQKAKAQAENQKPGESDSASVFSFSSFGSTAKLFKSSN